MLRIALAVTALFWTAGTPRAIQAQDPDNIDFTQVTRPVVEVTDSTTIDFLLFELFVEPLQLPTRIQVIDVTQNGFGPDDVMIAYPSAEAFLIPEIIPDSVQAIMSGWEPEVEYRMDSGNMSAEILASLIASSPDSTTRAESAILYDLVQAVDRSYRDLPLALLFQRDSVGFTFQLWDYNRPAMQYAPRPELVADSAISSVIAMLRDVGYVQGENVARTGLSLESQGDRVAAVGSALRGLMAIPDEQMRILAMRTVLVGAYDFDRSGSLDQAGEIDAPPCAVWIVLDEAFPDFMGRFGFSSGDAPYRGQIVFNIAENVREPAYGRGSACLSGEEPLKTLASDVVAPTAQGDLPENVERFVRLEAAGEILQRAGGLGTEAETWSREVRGVLAARFDRDGSGLLDLPVEIRGIPCDVWQAMAATHPDFPYGLGFLSGEVYVGDHLGVAPTQREELLARASGCVRPELSATALEDGAVAGETGPRVSAGLREFLDLLTAARIARGSAGMAAGSVEWAGVVESVLMNHYDLDGSGVLDQPDEVAEVPCPVWRTIEATYGAPLSGLGLDAESQFLADMIGIAAAQRLIVAAAIQGCVASG